jgi:NitT/TauT family transport system permease protein
VIAMNKKMILIVIVIIFVWEIVTSLNLVSSLFFASPASISYNLIELFAQDTVLLDLFATFWRTVAAFIISVIIGTPLGVSIGYFNKEGLSIETFLDFLRSIPPIALFPLFIFFFGIGDLSKIAVGAFAGTMIITIASIYGVKQINKIRLNLARKIGLKGKRLFVKVLLPESLDNIFGGYRVAASFCLILVIVTEMFLGGAEFGLGKRLIDAQMLYNIPQLYALIFISGVIGHLLNKSFVIAENRVIHWRGN